MGKQILLPTKVKSEIMKEFSVNRNDLRRALIYERNSNRAKMLRAIALERGGVVYTGEKTSNQSNESKNPNLKIII